MTLPSSHSFRRTCKNNLLHLAGISFVSAFKKILVINANEEMFVMWAQLRCIHRPLYQELASLSLYQELASHFSREVVLRPPLLCFTEIKLNKLIQIFV